MRLSAKSRFVAAATCVVAVFGSSSRNCVIGGEKIEVQAFAGKPFGVGKVTVPFTGTFRSTVLAGEGTWIEEKNDRTLYPAYRDMQARAVPRARGSRPDSVTVFFLFRSGEPLDLNFGV